MIPRTNRIRVWLCACGLLFALTLPLAAIQDQNPIPCKNMWSATYSGTETWQATTWTSTIYFSLGPNSSTGQWTTPGDTVDISLTASTSSGSLSTVAIVNSDLLLALGIQRPDLLAALQTAQMDCTVSAQSTACQNDIQAVSGMLSQDDIKKVATWWAGCQHKSKSQTVSFTGLHAANGYIIGGKTEGGSSAQVLGTITYHSQTPQPQTGTITGPVQTGEMPKEGTYTNTVVGHLNPLQPQHGGVVSGVTASVFAPTARGQFHVSTAGQVTFTGNVSPNNCPKPLPPQQIQQEQPPPR